MFQELFSNITNKDKDKAIENLFSHSVPDPDFFMMIILSMLMVTLGLISDNVSVVIGSMLIAPIMYPILGISMGIVMSDVSLISKSSTTLFKSSLLSVFVSMVMALLFASQARELTSQIIAITKPSLIYASIGAVAGLAVSFAFVKPKLSEALPGISISVALTPPLAVVGIGLARVDINMFLSSLLLFIINAVGIIFTAVIVFSLMKFYTERKKADAFVKKEEKKLRRAKV